MSAMAFARYCLLAAGAGGFLGLIFHHVDRLIATGKRKRAQKQFDEDVAFTLYRPQTAKPEVWFSILIFAHKLRPFQTESGAVTDPLEEVANRASRHYRDAKGAGSPLVQQSRKPIRQGAQLTVIPTAEGLEFNPPTKSFRWNEAVHGEEFRFKTKGDGHDLLERGTVSIYLNRILVGEILFSVSIDASGSHVLEDELIAMERCRRYRKVFASYSHDDVEIVESVEQCLRVTGDLFLRDISTLRSGDEWNEAIRRLIHEADILQLFWSRNSMKSPYVKNEWEYALSLSRRGFIRPVYWEVPMPEDPAMNIPPAELRCLHFSKLELQKMRYSNSSGHRAFNPLILLAAGSIVVGILAFFASRLGFKVPTPTRIDDTRLLLDSLLFGAFSLVFVLVSVWLDRKNDRREETAALRRLNL